MNQRKDVQLSHILVTRGLTKKFGGVTAVNDVTFSVDDRELRCVIGPNGAGKSTFFKLISGQIKPDAGQILFRGTDISKRSIRQIAGLGIGIKMQVPCLFEGLSVEENIRLSARIGNRKHSEARVRDVVDMIEIGEYRARKVNNLAHGIRQQVELAMVIASDPKLVLLDEPTAGMTTHEVKRAAKLIKRINEEAAVIVVEHDMSFIKMIAKKVTVLHQGEVFFEADVEAALQDQGVRDIYLGRRVVK